MNCVGIQKLIVDSMDRALTAADEQALVLHVAECAQCRRFLEVQRRLDRALAAKLASVRVEAGFDARLWMRIRAEGAEAGDNIAECRHLAEVERKRWLARWQSQFRRDGWQGLLDGAGLAAVLVVSAAGLTRLLAVGAAWQWPAIPSLDPRLIPAVLVAVLALGMGGLAARRVRSLRTGG